MAQDEGSVMLDELMRNGVAPVVAILRGVRQEEAVAIGQALVAAGIRLIEVPLNSPEPLRSIALLAAALGSDNLVGGGTVLSPSAVADVAAAGGRLIVTPNTNPAVIRCAVEGRLAVIPGFATASEAFAAIEAGATRLKLFPAVGFGVAYLKALREVLPADVQVWAVGGTNAETLPQWRDAGAAGAGVGSALYRPGDTPAQVGLRARALVAAWRGL